MLGCKQEIDDLMLPDRTNNKEFNQRKEAQFLTRTTIMKNV